MAEMRLGIISDTHGDLNVAQKALDAMGPISVLAHAGDFYEDSWNLAKLARLPAMAVKAVRGNCDVVQQGPLEELFSLGGVRILLTHGHRYQIKRGLEKLFHRAKESRTQVVIFGHSHVAKSFWQDDVLYINPGSPCLPRGAVQGSCAVLEINGKKITASMIYLGELSA